MSLRNINNPDLCTINGTPNYLGIIDFTATSKTNHQATTPFNNTGDALGGKMIIIQPDQDCYVYFVSSNTGTVTAATNGMLVYAGERIEMLMDSVNLWLACIRSTTSGNLKVWELK